MLRYKTASAPANIGTENPEQEGEIQTLSNPTGERAKNQERRSPLYAWMKAPAPRYDPDDRSNRLMHNHALPSVDGMRHFVGGQKRIDEGPVRSTEKMVKPIPGYRNLGEVRKETPGESKALQVGGRGGMFARAGLFLKHFLVSVGLWGALTQIVIPIFDTFKGFIGLPTTADTEREAAMQQLMTLVAFGTFALGALYVWRRYK